MCRGGGALFYLSNFRILSKIEKENNLSLVRISTSKNTKKGKHRVKRQIIETSRGSGVKQDKHAEARYTYSWKVCTSAAFQIFAPPPSQQKG